MTDADQIETGDGSTSLQRETEVRDGFTAMGDLRDVNVGTRRFEGTDAARVQGGES